MRYGGRRSNSAWLPEPDVVLGALAALAAPAACRSVPAAPAAPVAPAAPGACRTVREAVVTGCRRGANGRWNSLTLGSHPDVDIELGPLRGTGYTAALSMRASAIRAWTNDALERLYAARPNYPRIDADFFAALRRETEPLLAAARAAERGLTSQQLAELDIQLTTRVQNVVRAAASGYVGIEL